MVKPMRSLSTGSVDTTPMDVTPTVDVLAESTLPQTAQAPIEELPATPKVHDSTGVDTHLGSSKKPRKLKDDFGPTLDEYATSNRFDDSCTSFLEQSLIDHILFEFLVNSKLLNSTKFATRYNKSLVRELYANMDESIVNVESSFNGVVFVRDEIVDFNVEELYVFLEIPTHSDVNGTGLKDDIDLDMVIVELAGPVNMEQVMYYNCNLRLLLLKPHRSDFVIV
ncbi:hypothetical protein M9H77_12273 [Catharanthus roseus]|uniref:Uncharacterized protein n=1 Tax=Catharanthus roseus TaxID=4058 RepID=A0ACC0BGZ0_CATRO|nr:hypothetical protein M9H77_12273 [Catharanthus roseus]